MKFQIGNKNFRSEDILYMEQVGGDILRIHFVEKKRSGDPLDIWMSKEEQVRAILDWNTARDHDADDRLVKQQAMKTIATSG